MTQDSLFASHDKAVADIDRVLAAIDKPKRVIHPALRYWAERADTMALNDKEQREHVVVDMGNHNYQVYLRITSDKCDREFQYSSLEGFV